MGPTTIIAFPVKHNWFQDADPSLIETSTKQLVEIVVKRVEEYSPASPG